MKALGNSGREADHFPSHEEHWSEKIACMISVIDGGSCNFVGGLTFSFGQGPDPSSPALHSPNTFPTEHPNFVPQTSPINLTFAIFYYQTQTAPRHGIQCAFKRGPSPGCQTKDHSLRNCPLEVPDVPGQSWTYTFLCDQQQGQSVYVS